MGNFGEPPAKVPLVPMSHPGVCGVAGDQKHIDLRSASVYDVVNYLA